MLKGKKSPRVNNCLGLNGVQATQVAGHGVEVCGGNNLRLNGATQTLGEGRAKLVRSQKHPPTAPASTIDRENNEHGWREAAFSASTLGDKSRYHTTVCGLTPL